MKPMTKMMMIRKMENNDNGISNGYQNRYSYGYNNANMTMGGYADNRNGGYNNGDTRDNGGMENTMGYEMENRFRDRRGREHYDNGRYAPKNEMENTISDTMENNAMRYGMGKEQKRESRIGFTSSDDDEYETEFSQMDAERWVRSMKGEDGSSGAHWNMEQIKQLMAQKGIDGNPLEFYAAMNAIYSDYSKALKKHNAGDKIDLYVDLAKAFMHDKDAQPNKLARYYKYIVKH